MKQLVMGSFFALIFLWTGVSSAQKSPRAHQFFVSYGLLDLTYLGHAARFTFSKDMVQHRLMGQPGLAILEYRQVREHFGFGISVSSRNLLSVRRYADGSVFSNNYRYNLVLPHIEYFWVAQGNYVVSSQLGIGFQAVRDIALFQQTVIDYSEYNRLAFQFSPLIVSFGTRKVQARFDVGIGQKGFGSIGLGYQL